MTNADNSIDFLLAQWGSEQQKLSQDLEFESRWLRPFAYTVAVSLARELDMLGAIQKITSIQDVAFKLGMRLSPLSCLLNLLSQMELIRFHNVDFVELTPFGQRILNPRKACEFVFPIFHFYEIIRRHLSNLPEIARGNTGTLPMRWPPVDINGCCLFEPLMTATAPYVAAWIDECGDFQNSKAMLDVGGGDGTIASMLCEKHPLLRAQIVNLPYAQGLVQETTSRRGTEERTQFVPMDFLVDPLPVGFDIVLFSRMLSDWDDGIVSNLLGQTQSILNESGTVYIVEPLARMQSAKEPQHPWTLFWELLVPGFQLHGPRSIGQWEAIAGSAGLSIRTVRECGRLPFPDLAFIELVRSSS